MKLQILGPGCAKCTALLQNAQTATTGTGVELEKITDLARIMSFGVMSTPALAIDGRVKAAGRVLSVDEIRKLIA